MSFIYEVDHYQSEESKQPEETSPHPHQSSTYAGTFTSGTHFVCSNWVSHISKKRLKYLTMQFHLPSAILKPSPNDRPYTPLPYMATFSEAIIRGSASIPLHPFLIEVFHYYNIVLF